MSRWSPDARGRLEQAAHDLFLERGYEQTTVSDIAARAGLTERTFFRHFADKREVLFSGSAMMQDGIVRALGEAPRDLPAIEAVRIAIEAIARFLHGRRAFGRERRRIVLAHPDLQERDLIKRAKLTGALAGALRERGVEEPAASLTADIGVAVFYIGFDQWLDDPSDRELVDIIHEGFERLKTVASGA